LADIENGFFDRLLLAPCRRLDLLIGPLLYSLARALLPTTLVPVVALSMGARLQEVLPGVILLYAGGLGVAVVYGLLGLVLVYKMRSQRAVAIAQTLVFTSSFLSIGQVPLHLQTGWLHAVSRVNPFTNVLRMTRQGFLDGGVTASETWPGLLALAAMITILGLLAARGLRKLGP
jgi:ABC-2 type transport system permease protein